MSNATTSVAGWSITEAPNEVSAYTNFLFVSPELILVSYVFYFERRCCFLGYSIVSDGLIIRKKPIPYLVSLVI